MRVEELILKVEYAIENDLRIDFLTNSQIVNLDFDTFEHKGQTFIFQSGTRKYIKF